MTGAGAIDMAAAHRQLLVSLLKAHLPTGSKAWVFGSRVSGKAQRYSDLDLVVDAGRRLTSDETASLREALSESDLPYMVDLADWHALSGRFRSL